MSGISGKIIKTAMASATLLLLSVMNLYGAGYVDQHYVIKNEDLVAGIETSQGVQISEDGRRVMLVDGTTYGYVIFKPQASAEPFDRGLPSWNGTAPDDRCGFMVQMRFPYGNGWSPWLTVGYWKRYIFGSYGSTSYGGGYIDYDYVKLYSYQSEWQFKVILRRQVASLPTPEIYKLSFFISDSRTTATLNMSQIVQDKPDEIFIPTEFLYQYAIDDQIGGSICSPTSVSMILKSYDIDVDPLEFARDTRDPYYGLFGVWPRVVQNAAEYGLDGAVTRYRSWSEARDVLAMGGRIAMSVSKPLYSGHLMMLAGFTSQGNPIVHDPARSNGYGYIFNKTSLSQSWFNKGGIAYTFFPEDDLSVSVDRIADRTAVPDGVRLLQNYPNPFNGGTQITFSLPHTALVDLSVYDIRGRHVETLLAGELASGSHVMMWQPSDLPSGMYCIRLSVDDYLQTIRALYLK